MVVFPDNVPISKRLFDLIFTVVGLLLISPILLILIILVFLYHGKPVLFTQQRPGYKGVSFLLYKFRTMTNAHDLEGNLLSDEQRLTSFGRFLRSTSLDELPELFNVLKGDMSLVGPRPLLVQYLNRYSTEQSHRHDVMPGITGWAQINGRNVQTWEERFQLDNWYVDHWSFWFDLKILFLTIWKVIQREGINQDGHATMEEFWGNNKKS